jgi:hypothetical protein
MNCCCDGRITSTINELRSMEVHVVLSVEYAIVKADPVFAPARTHRVPFIPIDLHIPPVNSVEAAARLDQLIPSVLLATFALPPASHKVPFHPTELQDAVKIVEIEEGDAVQVIPFGLYAIAPLAAPPVPITPTATHISPLDATLFIVVNMSVTEPTEVQLIPSDE